MLNHALRLNQIAAREIGTAVPGPSSRRRHCYCRPAMLEIGLDLPQVGDVGRGIAQNGQTDGPDFQEAMQA